MNSCMHEKDVPHNEHTCTQHKSKPKSFSQQPRFSTPEQEIAEADTSKEYVENQKSRAVHFDLTVNDTEDEDQPPVLEDSSSDDGEVGAVDMRDSSSESESEVEEEDDRQDKQRQREQYTGQLDFDYETYVCSPVPGGLRNHVRSLISQTWNICDEEYKNKGNRVCCIDLPKEIPLPDPLQVWWTESPDRMSTVNQDDMTQKWYDAWKSFDAPRWNGPLFPDRMSEEQRKTARKEMSAMPEVFYTKTQLPVITPENLKFLFSIWKGFLV